MPVVSKSAAIGSSITAVFKIAGKKRCNRMIYHYTVFMEITNPTNFQIGTDMHVYQGLENYGSTHV